MWSNAMYSFILIELLINVKLINFLLAHNRNLFFLYKIFMDNVLIYINIKISFISNFIEKLVHIACFYCSIVGPFDLWYFIYIYIYMYILKMSIWSLLILKIINWSYNSIIILYKFTNRAMQQERKLVVSPKKFLPFVE